MYKKHIKRVRLARLILKTLEPCVMNILKGDSRTSSSPTLIRSYIYDAYGKTAENYVDSTNYFKNDVAYTGAVYDSETNLYYLMSRYYDPKAGSFISQDSYKGEGDAFWHLYAYCDGDPVNKTDKTGRKSFSFNKSAKKSILVRTNGGDTFDLCRFIIRCNLKVKGKTLSSKQCVFTYFQLHYLIQNNIFKYSYYNTYSVGNIKLGSMATLKPSQSYKGQQMYTTVKGYHQKYLTFNKISKTSWRRDKINIRFYFYFWKSASDYTRMTPTPNFVINYSV